MSDKVKVAQPEDFAVVRTLLSGFEKDKSDLGRAITDSLSKVLETARQNVCDICAGKGIPVSQFTCMCGGSGMMSDGVPYLRMQIITDTGPYSPQDYDDE